MSLLPLLSSLFIYALGVMILAGLVVNVVFMIRRLGFTRRSAPPTIHDLRTRPWTLGQATGLSALILFLHACLLGAMWAANVFSGLDSETLTSVSVVLHTLLFHCTVLAAVVIMLRRRRWTWREAFGFRFDNLRRDLLNAGAIYLAAMPVVLLAGLVYSNLLTDIGFDVKPQDVVSIFSEEGYPAWVKIYLAAAAVTVVPAAEELFFRGMILPILARYTTCGTAVFTVSIMFALMHLHVPSFLPLFVIAMAFGYAYLHSGTLLTPIIMHSVFNAIGLAASFLMEPAAGAAIAAIIGN